MAITTPDELHEILIRREYNTLRVAFDRAFTQHDIADLSGDGRLIL